MHIIGLAIFLVITGAGAVWLGQKLIDISNKNKNK